MDVRIGIIHTPRELSFETEASADDVRGNVESALTEGHAFVSLTDSKGKQYVVPTATIAYVEFGSDTSRRVGFVS